MTHRPRILLVDDEAAIQRAVGPLLRSRGYEVDVAATGADALDRFAQTPSDLIVLDLGLPDLEGTEVCRRVRAKSDVPIIVLSARGGEADKVNALDVGADDYVTKPFWSGGAAGAHPGRAAAGGVGRQPRDRSAARRGADDRLRPAARGSR
jgi:DNA-binding response OmpR family regulator